MSNKISRRQFVQGATVLGIGVVLAACTPKATPTPEAKPQTGAGAQTQPQAPTTAPAAAPAGQKVQLRHMIWDQVQQPAVADQAKMFMEQNPDIAIEIQVVPWSQYWDKLWTALAGGGAPDTFWLNMSNFAALSYKGTLLNIQDYLDKDPNLQKEWDMNFDSLKAAYKFEGKAMSWPRDYDTIAIAVNLKLLEEAGLAFPDETDSFKVWDWAMCRSYAEKLTKVEGGRTIQFGLAATNTAQEGWFNWVYSNGGSVLNADKTKCTLNEPPAIEALKDYIAYRRDGLSPGEEAIASQEVNDMFYTGRVAMSIVGDWNLKDFNERITDFEYDLVPIPYAPTGKSMCMIHGLGDTIDKNTKNPDAAFKWVSFLGSKDGSTILGKTGTVIPSRRDTAELWFDPSFKPKHRRIYLEWTDKSVFWPNTAVPATSEWTKPINDELALAFEQGKDIQQAMDDAAKKVDEILAGKGA